MESLVNIVHPHVLKVRNGTPVLGAIEEYFDRDKKIVDFLRTSLDLGIKILRFDDISHGEFYNCLIKSSFKEPPYNGIMYDERIIQVKAPSNAVPILNEKPKDISEEDWMKLNEMVVSHTELKELIGNPGKSFYIGGFREYCLINAAAYQRDFYTLESEMLVVEEFSPIHSKESFEEMKKEFTVRNIQTINYEQAVKLLKEDNKSQQKSL